MRVKKIEIEKKVNDSDLKKYRERNLREETNDGIVGWTALDVGMDLPIVTIDFGGEYERIDLINPVITETSEKPLVYLEYDHEKDKIRKTVRNPSIVVETSNMGTLAFEANRNEWKDREELMSDEGLFECVTAQRLIDAINGITPNDPERRYNTQVTTNKIGRNEKVMLQSPEGETTFIKYKHAEKLIEDGYQLI